MTQITFHNLIKQTQDHPDFKKIVSKRLRVHKRRGEGYPSVEKQMTIFTDYLTTSSGGTELTFEISPQGTVLKSIHDGAVIAERIYTAHDSTKRGKLRTCREVTGQVSHDRIGNSLSDPQWSGVSHSSWGIVGTMVQELFSLLDSEPPPNEEKESFSPHADLRQRLKDRFIFLDKYAPQETEAIYMKMWDITESVISKMETELSDVK